MNLLVLATLGGCSPDHSPAVMGTLERHRIELRAERMEPVRELTAREGDIVQEGEVLLRLDSRRAVAWLDQARAVYDLRRARLAELMRGARPEAIALARAELAEAQAVLGELNIELVRATALLDTGGGTQAALDAIAGSQAAAQARRQALQAALDEILNGATAEELDQARAEVALSEREMGRLEIDLERMTVVAPRSGTIDALPFRVGDEPPAGAVVVVLLVDQAPFARVYLPVELRTKVSVGQRAAVAIDGFPTPFQGVVRTISGEAAFTPYYSLSERDRSHFAYLTQIDLVQQEAKELPTGLPLQVRFF